MERKEKKREENQSKNIRRALGIVDVDHIIIIKKVLIIQLQEPSKYSDLRKPNKKRTNIRKLINIRRDEERRQ